MVDHALQLPGLSPVYGKAVVARFNGGELSSDGGVLALREIETCLGLADRLAACLMIHGRRGRRFTAWSSGSSGDTPLNSPISPTSAVGKPR